MIDSFYDRSHPDQQGDRHGGPQPGRGGRAGHRRAAGAAGEPAGRPDRGPGDPAVDALRRQPDALLRHRRQPDEPGGDRLRPDRRQRRDRHRELRQPPVARRPGDRAAIDVVRDATLEVRKPVVFGVAIITLVHLPILALEGVEGKMFRPMAATSIFALTGSLLLSLTATPVLASFFLAPGMSERDTWPIRLAKRVYEPILRPSWHRPVLVALAALAMLAATVPVALNLGRRVHPQARRGGPGPRPDPPPRRLAERGGPPDTTRLEKALLAAFPDEIRSVVSRPAGPRSAWTRRRSTPPSATST